MTKFLKSVVRRWDSRIGYAKSDPVKKLLKVLAGSLDRGVLSRFLSYSILKSEFENLRNVSVCEERKDVWYKALQFIDSAPLTYIEFGVLRETQFNFFVPIINTKIRNSLDLIVSKGCRNLGRGTQSGISLLVALSLNWMILVLFL